MLKSSYIHCSTESHLIMYSFFALVLRNHSTHSSFFVYLYTEQKTLHPTQTFTVTKFGTQFCTSGFGTRTHEDGLDSSQIRGKGGGVGDGYVGREGGNVYLGSGESGGRCRSLSSLEAYAYVWTFRWKGGGHGGTSA